MENQALKNNGSRKLIIFEIACVILMITLIGYTYSYFNVTATNDTVITGQAASLSLKLTVTKVAPSNNNGLVPQLDSAITNAVIGRNGSCIDDNNNSICQVYQITVKNTSSSAISVNGKVKLNAGNNPNLKWAQISGTTSPTLVSSINTYSVVNLTSNELYNANETKNYYIVIWISETGIVQSDTGNFTGVVTFKDVNQEDIVEPNSPKLVNGLIPVYYNDSTNKWVKADSNNTSNSWYDYDQKKWANAVLVTSTNRATYQSASAGTTINDSDILAFYVWIPRYKYKVWNINKVVGTDSYSAYNKGIDIKFENGTETSGTITCNYDFTVTEGNGLSETCTGSNGDYYTHPAFTFGDNELTGFWIGKFEISSSDPSATDGGGNTTSLTTKIIPNVVSWRSNPVSNFWKVIYDMQASSNIYGLPTDRTNIDSHMLTNMEWGAVAYLTNSKYGRCTDGTCTEVELNSNSSYTTGCGPQSQGSKSSGSTCNAYNTTLGMLASTTGNIYGVYDMSGGGYEYVMGNMSSASGSYTYYARYAGTNYTYTGNEKYVTTYSYGTTNDDQQAYNRARLGDATGEVMLSASSSGAWHSHYSRFPLSSYPWFGRGGYCSYGSGAGMFHFYKSNGSSYSAYSARAALAGFAS